MPNNYYEFTDENILRFLFGASFIVVLLRVFKIRIEDYFRPLIISQEMDIPIIPEGFKNFELPEINTAGTEMDDSLEEIENFLNSLKETDNIEKLDKMEKSYSSLLISSHDLTAILEEPQQSSKLIGDDNSEIFEMEIIGSEEEGTEGIDMD